MQARQVHSLSQRPGGRQGAATPDLGEAVDPQERSEMDNIVFLAMKAAARLGQPGAEMKEALLLLVQAVARMGQLAKKAVADRKP